MARFQSWRSGECGVLLTPCCILTRSGNIYKQQLYGHQLPITKTIKIRRTRHAGHCWRSRDEIISDILLSTHSHGQAKAGRPVQTYIQQFCADTRCSLEDLPDQWIIGRCGGRRSEISVLIARRDDDESIYLSIYLSACVNSLLMLCYLSVNHFSLLFLFWKHYFSSQTLSSSLRAVISKN